MQQKPENIYDSEKGRILMCSNVPAMSGRDIDKIFGVKSASEFNTAGMELRYSVEYGQVGDPEYYKCRVFQDLKGNYYMVVKGAEYSLFVPDECYPIKDREICIQCTPEALYEWASHCLVREEYHRAMTEFSQSTNDWGAKIWEYRGSPYEFLVRTDAGSYRLYSTEYTYPCIGSFLFRPDESEFAQECTQYCRDNMCCYFVTPEVARRWAEARGMDEAASQKAFG